jgi:hypothetical protein
MKNCVVLLCIILAVTGASARDYNSPLVDGHVTVGVDDWNLDEWAVDDSPYDCRWGASDPDLDDLYVTWDGGWLYVGVTTTNLPSIYGSGYLVYIDTDAQNGITGATDFTGAEFYPRSITFSTMGVDILMGVWNLETASFEARHCSDPMHTAPVGEVFAATSTYWLHMEAGVSWDGLYGLGPGNVPPGTTLRFIVAVVGGEPSGAYDAMPTSSTGAETDPALPWYEYTDLDVYYEVVVDANGDGIPDSGATAVEAGSWGRVKSLFR